MSKSKTLEIKPNAKEEIRSKPHWTGINKAWWVIVDKEKEIAKGSNPSNAWKSAYRKLQKTKI